MTCSIEGCDRPTHAAGYCTKHYRRWKVHGDPLREVRAPGRTPSERFWALVEVRGPGDCWPYTGHLNRQGYGHFTIVAKSARATSEGPTGTQAHHFAYTDKVGPVPPGWTVEHTCHSDSDCPGGPTCPHRPCCNLAHLIAMTNRDNVLAGRTLPAANAAKTHCDAGHLFDEANTRINPATGERVCRTCARENMRRYRAATRQ